MHHHHTPVLSHDYINTPVGSDARTHRWTLEALSTALPPPPGVFPMNPRPCVSHLSLGWLDGGSGHRQTCGPLLVPPIPGPSRASPWDLKLLRSSSSPSRFRESSESDGGWGGGTGRVSGMMPEGLEVPMALGHPPSAPSSHPEFPFSSVLLGFPPCSAAPGPLVAGQRLSGEQVRQGHPFPTQAPGLLAGA